MMPKNLMPEPGNICNKMYADHDHIKQIYRQVDNNHDAQLQLGTTVGEFFWAHQPTLTVKSKLSKQTYFFTFGGFSRLWELIALWSLKFPALFQIMICCFLLRRREALITKLNLTLRLQRIPIVAYGEGGLIETALNLLFFIFKWHQKLLTPESICL